MTPPVQGTVPWQGVYHWLKHRVFSPAVFGAADEALQGMESAAKQNNPRECRGLE